MIVDNLFSVCYIRVCIPYAYKLLRDVIFAVFAGNLSFTKIKSLNSHNTYRTQRLITK